MAIMTKFFFYFSVRLGSILVAIVTLIQSASLLFLHILNAESLNFIFDVLNKSFRSLSFKIVLKVIDNYNSKAFVLGAIVFYACLTCSSVLLLFGSYKCKPLLIYPFIFFFIFYIFELIFILVLLILYVKTEGNGLGDLILYSNFAAFILLLYFYKWACVVSNVQIINELRQRLARKIKLLENINKQRRIIKKTVQSISRNVKGSLNHRGFYY